MPLQIALTNNAPVISLLSDHRQLTTDQRIAIPSTPHSPELFRTTLEKNGGPCGIIPPSGVLQISLRKFYKRHPNRNAEHTITLTNRVVLFNVKSAPIRHSNSTTITHFI